MTKIVIVMASACGWWPCTRSLPTAAAAKGRGTVVVCMLRPWQGAARLAGLALQWEQGLSPQSPHYDTCYFVLKCI